VWYVVIFRILLQTSKNTTAKLDGPMTCGYGIDAIDAAAATALIADSATERGLEVSAE
jgi:hypothetical protein